MIDETAFLICHHDLSAILRCATMLISVIWQVPFHAKVLEVAYSLHFSPFKSLHIIDDCTSGTRHEIQGIDKVSVQ